MGRIPRTDLRYSKVINVVVVCGASRSHADKAPLYPAMGPSFRMMLTNVAGKDMGLPVDTMMRVFATSMGFTTATVTTPAMSEDTKCSGFPSDIHW